MIQARKVADRAGRQLAPTALPFRQSPKAKRTGVLRTPHGKPCKCVPRNAQDLARASPENAPGEQYSYSSFHLVKRPFSAGDLCYHSQHDVDSQPYLGDAALPLRPLRFRRFRTTPARSRRGGFARAASRAAIAKGSRGRALAHCRNRFTADAPAGRRRGIAQQKPVGSLPRRAKEAASAGTAEDLRQPVCVSTALHAGTASAKPLAHAAHLPWSRDMRRIPACWRNRPKLPEKAFFRNPRSVRESARPRPMDKRRRENFASAATYMRSISVADGDDCGCAPVPSMRIRRLRIAETEDEPPHQHLKERSDDLG